jgi:hypothetical protein
MEFVCPDPEATVRAANVRATLDAFGLLPSVGRQIIEKHQLNLSDLRPENFVRVQRWLDALKEIQTDIGPSVVRKVGARIIENADFPPRWDSVESVLEALDEIYYLNHRGNVGHYRVSRQSDGSLLVRCETPYPRYFEWGLIEGICRGKMARGHQYRVDFRAIQDPGDATCMLTVYRADTR